MTTLTTILGLLPMAIGIGGGGEIRAPMAITVIGGLSVSTLLTLVLIPVVYNLVDHKALRPEDDRQATPAQEIDAR
jgi:HAE1 family hydrophobic/amphiphilic exporter-1